MSYAGTMTSEREARKEKFQVDSTALLLIYSIEKLFKSDKVKTWELQR